MSNVPAIIDALISQIGTAVGSSAVVIDGPPMTGQEGDYVCVGWSPIADGAASAPQRVGGLGAQVRDEEFAIDCWIDSMGGGSDATDFRARRLGAFAILSLIEAALKADVTLGGVTPVGYAVIGDVSLHQSRTPSGVDCGITFSVVGQART